MTQVRAPDIATKEEVLETFTQLMREIGRAHV